MSDSPKKIHRTGPLGALMDELERATAELVQLISGLSDSEFELVRDPEATDDPFRSVQTVVHHVARAGYAHANHLRVAFAAEGSRPNLPLGSRAESVKQLRAMLAYVEATLDGRWEMTEEEISAVQFQARWGPTYDVEQMLEHTIVHVLRHRRQIERFLGR